MVKIDVSLSCLCFCFDFVQSIDLHKDVLDKAKGDYESLKKTMDELRAAEVWYY